MKSQTEKTKVASKAVRAVVKAKPVKKSLSKPAPKVPVKGVAAKVVKTVSKAVTGSGAKKAPVKAVKPIVKANAKATTKVEVKVKVKAKDSVKSTTAKATKSPTLAPPAKVKPLLTPVKNAVLSVSAKPVEMMVPVALATASVPARAGRPSSRLAQLTVPSMAQSVASTAAKASFTQTTSSPLIVPPLASAVKRDPKLANNWKTKPVEQLTPADVIAMPDDAYMNDTQLGYFRLKLLTLKHDILSNAGETTEHLRADTVVVPDPADRATIEEEHALELRTRDRERKLLKKIEQSIARIDSGDYGYCDETGEPIGVGRLLARPTANLSLEAQQRRELKQKMFGD